MAVFIKLYIYIYNYLTDDHNIYMECKTALSILGWPLEFQSNEVNYCEMNTLWQENCFE